ncbi:hypothetical protein AB0F93_00010 [Micromonospora tulbaghiae]|uniref:hypothetical protein n=1 Tax=Micromonospora tulbaghiae TaxID=479978 RepID=UPI003330B292
MSQHDDTAAVPIISDEPLMVSQPRRRLKRILVLYALLSLICGAAGGYIGYSLSDARVEALEADLMQRRANRAAEDDARDARDAQTRRDLCIVLDRIQPRDAPLEDMRRRYGCNGRIPGARPSSSATAGPSPTASAGRRTAAGVAPAPAPAVSGPRGPARPTGPAGRPAPTPRPSTGGPPPTYPRPPVTPAPSRGPTQLLDVCVPLLNLCL